MVVIYPCPKCNIIFYKMSNYKRHLNKKKSCEINNNINEINLIPHNLLKIPHLAPKNDNQLNDNITGEKEYECEYCHKSYSKKYNLERHQRDSCKEKKTHKDKLDKIDDKLNLILEQNIKLQKENKKLKEKINKKQNVNIINNTINTINTVNTINNDNSIVNFNDFDYTGVDKKLFINPLLNAQLYGKAIILQMIENIYINEALPEYHNIVITDKNRGYVKIYNNGKWKTDDINTINLVLNGIIDHSKTIWYELKQRYLNNNPAQSRLNTSKKYIDLCDLEYLDELEDEQANGDANNSALIKRCKDFREMVYKDTINLFHDNKNILIKPKIKN